MKNPHSKDKRQALLTFMPNSNCSENVGVVGTWSFDQDMIRKALSRMVIVDELPFKFVEGEGFKNFILSTCPRFKIHPDGLFLGIVMIFT